MFFLQVIGQSFLVGEVVKGSLAKACEKGGIGGRLKKN